MTPTEQDKELRELVHIVQNADTTYDAMQFIKADRKRVALEARIDELDNILRSLAYDAMESGVDNSKHEYVLHISLSTAKTAIQSIIRTEKLKLLAEVREQVIGKDCSDEVSGGSCFDQIYANTIKNELKDEQRTALTKLEAEL